MIKKICILLFGMMVLFSSSVFADGVKISDRNFNLDIRPNVVRTYLGADKDQCNSLEFIFDELKRDMEFASTMDSERSQNMVTASALKKNLQLIGTVLDREQYRKYLRILNMTLINKGFSIPDIVER